MRGISRSAMAGALMVALTGVASANVIQNAQHSRGVHAKGTIHASMHKRMIHRRHFARFRGYAPVYGYGYGYGYGAPVSSSVSSSYTGNTTATRGLSGSSGTGN